MAGSASVENFILPPCAELARVTFAATLIGKEVRQALQHITHVCAIVKDHDGTGAEGQARRAQVLKRQDHIQVFLNSKGTRSAAHEHRLKLAPLLEPARKIE